MNGISGSIGGNRYVVDDLHPVGGIDRDAVGICAVDLIVLNDDVLIRNFGLIAEENTLSLTLASAETAIVHHQIVMNVDVDGGGRRSNRQELEIVGVIYSRRKVA